MPKTTLRRRLLRLAVQDSKLRPRIVEMLEASGGLSAHEAAAVRKMAQGNTSVVQQPPIVISQPPIVVQQEAPAPMMVPVAPAPVQMVPGQPTPWGMPAAPATVSPNVSLTQTPENVAVTPPPEGVLLVTERTQQGFEADLLPEMERLLAQGQSRPQIATAILEMLRTAFRQKDMLYNILIRHQSTFESDEEYRESLEKLVGAWANTTDSGV